VPNSTPLKSSPKIRKKDLLKRIERLESIILKKESDDA
jgi:hypothetical protein